MLVRYLQVSAFRLANNSIWQLLAQHSGIERGAGCIVCKRLLQSNKRFEPVKIAKRHCGQRAELQELLNGAAKGGNNIRDH